MTQDSNPLPPARSWAVAQNGIPCKATFPFASKELADSMAKKLNKMFSVSNFSSIQQPLTPKND